MQLLYEKNEDEKSHDTVPLHTILVDSKQSRRKHRIYSALSHIAFSVFLHCLGHRRNNFSAV
jgi:hypothetical protein